MSIMDQYISLEDELELWQPMVSGKRLWPSIRNSVLVAVYLRELGYQIGNPGVPIIERLTLQQWNKHLKTIKFLFRSLQSKNPEKYSAFFLIGKRQEVIYSPYFERMPNALLAEYNSDLQPTAKESKVILGNQLLMWAFAYSQVTKLTKHQEETIREYVNTVTQNFGLESMQNKLIAQLNRYIKVGRHLEAMISKFIVPHINGDLAFISNGHYLNYMGLIISSLHKAGFTVAESQHGMLHREHFAYNFAPHILEDPSHPGRQFLPDILLTFGEYWAKQIHTPAQKVTIGFPQLEKSVKHLLHTQSIPKFDILIVSHGGLTDKFVSLTQYIASRFSHYKICYKLHPSEIKFKERYKSLSTLANVEIVGMQNIHELIANSRIIVGEASTVMFEALAFPEKRIFYIENDVIPAQIGTSFTTVEELIALIDNPEAGLPATDRREFWQPDWEVRVSEFLDQHITTH